MASGGSRAGAVEGVGKGVLKRPEPWALSESVCAWGKAMKVLGCAGKAGISAFVGGAALALALVLALALALAFAFAFAFAFVVAAELLWPPNSALLRPKNQKNHPCSATMESSRRALLISNGNPLNPTKRHL